MVEVFREVWRVLRDDGSVWLNLGDSYASSGATGHGGWDGNNKNPDGTPRQSRQAGDKWARSPTAVAGLKPKDLVGIPWRVAFALQADGWFLRSDIIWHKPNPMPESVTDRCTKSHEYIFMLTKRARYFYDSEAIKEPLLRPDEFSRKTPAVFGGALKHVEAGKQSRLHSGNPYTKQLNGRNRRTVWSIATQPYSGAHFATFPEALVEPCIKAGSSERGVCAECGAPWERVVERTGGIPTTGAGRGRWPRPEESQSHGGGRTNGGGDVGSIYRTTGWRPTCDHDAAPIPATILDPFFGSGTVGLVARRLGRNFAGVDLSFEYLQLARERLGLTALDAWNSGDGAKGDDDMTGLPLFEATT
jgi:DNA modification methylase